MTPNACQPELDETTRALVGLRRYATRGLTLVELLVSMAITAVIMLAVGSSMLIATKAMPDASSAANSTITAGEVAEQLAAELQYAVSVLDRSANMIEFTVEDRDGDDVAETIRYEWSGTPGDPLTRQYNSGSVVDILDRVQEFDLSYDLQTISEEIPQGNESAETLLKSNNSYEDFFNYGITSTQWYGQYFLPSLPGDAVSWKVTRVRFKARTDGAADGECKVQLQLPTAGNSPSGVVLEEKTLLESTLLWYYTTQEFAFSNVSGLSPQQGLCLVFRSISGGTACRLLGQDEDVYTSNISLLKSTDRGATWSTRYDESLFFWIYGTVTTVGEPHIQKTYYLTTAQIKLRTGTDGQSAVQTRTTLLNRPEVTQ
jgi:prepilin-type N-terminal cleavage/methylation domain-containing protein